MSDKQPRLPRIERDEPLLVHEDENSHLWAVSYSDFLMVLLSFFILFFSADNTQKQKLIMNLADQFQGSSMGKSALKTGTGGTGMDGGGGTGRVPASLIQSLSGLNISMDKEKESLIVHFADNFFSPGEHKITGPNQKTVAHFLEVLKPYSDKVNLYFEGHADQQPMVNHRNDIIVDNFVLSSLRASSAVILARKMGFSEKNLFIQADSSNTRNSRTLSIRIEPKEEAL